MLTRRIFQQRKKTYILKNNFRKINSFRDLPPPPSITHHKASHVTGTKYRHCEKTEGKLFTQEDFWWEGIWSWVVKEALCREGGQRGRNSVQGPGIGLPEARERVSGPRTAPHRGCVPSLKVSEHSRYLQGM